MGYNSSFDIQDCLLQWILKSIHPQEEELQIDRYKSNFWTSTKRHTNWILNMFSCSVVCQTNNLMFLTLDTWLSPWLNCELEHVPFICSLMCHEKIYNVIKGTSLFRLTFHFTVTWSSIQIVNLFYFIYSRLYCPVFSIYSFMISISVSHVRDKFIDVQLGLVVTFEKSSLIFLTPSYYCFLTFRFLICNLIVWYAYEILDKVAVWDNFTGLSQ